jgi:hypothetical protein
LLFKVGFILLKDLKFLALSIYPLKMFARISINSTKKILFKQGKENITTQIESADLFFVKTNECLQYFTPSFCNYSAFLILFGYILFMLIWPLTIKRMQFIKKKFRNQYNLNFLWLCSIMLIICIDLSEYVIAGDGYIYSNCITLINCFQIFLGVFTLIKYMEYNVIDGRSMQNLMSILFSIIFLLIMVIARLWTRRILSRVKQVEKLTSFDYYILNTHFFLYYIVYSLFACVQVIIIIAFKFRV